MSIADNSHIDLSTVKIPKNWINNSPMYKTQKELAKARRLDWIPDKSFDLNGDGTVSAREYAISKMFDFDFDNKLNAQEKAYCIQRLKEGFEDGLYWDADQGAGRIVQRDGKIMLQGVEYGVGKDSAEELVGKTLPLINQQRTFEKRKLNAQVFENFLQKEKEKNDRIEKMCTYNPVKEKTGKELTFSKIKQAKALNIRKKAGLSPEPHDEKTLRRDPSMEYVKSPKVHTFTELRQKRIMDKCIDYQTKYVNIFYLLIHINQ